MKLWSVAVCLLVMSSGCARQQMEPFRAPMPDNLTVSQVSSKVSDFKGRQIRWGGLIVRVDHESNQASLEIIERDLDSAGRPVLAEARSVRFIAKVENQDRRWDRALGRDVTIIGTVVGEQVQAFIQGEVRYVVISANSFHLWDAPGSGSRELFDDPWQREGAPQRRY